MGQENKVFKELGHESGGTPKWMLPVVGVLLIGGALVAAYYLHPDRAGEVSYSDEFERALKIKQSMPSDPRELQKLVLDKNDEVAKLASVRLALTGDAGWTMLFDRISRASPKVQRYVQDFTFAENMWWCASDAAESDDKNQRDGALVVLDRYPNVKMPPWAPSYVFASMLAIWPEEQARTDKLYAIMERFHPVDLAPFFAALKEESAAVRAAAVSALRESAGVNEVVEARIKGGAPDQTAVTALGAAIDASIRAAKSPPATE